MLTSGAGSPMTLNLLPDNHVVVLRRSQITGSLEDAWDRLRDHQGDAGMPRTAMFVSGPSSTADIELTLYLGAHGPRRLHIILVED
jgi:L-lactate dehydrogenase complex protein LldG